MSRPYLLLYNIVLAAGWSSIAWAAVREYSQSGELKHIYRVVEKSLFLFQSAAIMEVLHCVLGLVRSSVIITLLQVTSRLFLVWGVLGPVPRTHNSPGFILLLTAWSVTEILRYSYYAFNQLNMVPGILTYLRYTLFIVLYPIGVTGEIMCIIRALDWVKETGLYSLGMPNRWNISLNYYYTLCLSLPVYVIAFPQLYSHMFRQRKKMLGKELKVE